tara:strand:- start:1966 stop:2178 length:213 start_codon:yes stop_codon:yes gene_type:complete
MKTYHWMEIGKQSHTNVNQWEVRKLECHQNKTDIFKLEWNNSKRICLRHTMNMIKSGIIVVFKNWIGYYR